MTNILKAIGKLTNFRMSHEYQDRDGKTVYTTDIIANNVEFLGGKAEAKADLPEEDLGTFTYASDDMPF